MALSKTFSVLALFAVALTGCSGSETIEEDEEGADEGALESKLEAFVGEAAPRPSLPGDFARLEAHEKQRLVWERVIAPEEIRCNLAAAVRNAPERIIDEMTTCEQTEGGLPKSTFANTMVDGVEAVARTVFKGAGLLKPAFDATSDEMVEGRKKLLHPYGAVAKIEFRQVAAQTGYTGLFEGGGHRPFVGVARISSGGAESLLGGFVPGMALKFFVQGGASIDMQVMHGMRSQKADEGSNPFARPFSNEFETQGASLFIQAGMKLFDLVHAPSNVLPLDNTATRMWNSSTSLAPVAPRKVVFTPTPEIQAASRAFVTQRPGSDHRFLLAAVTKNAGEGDAAQKLYVVRNDQGVELGSLYATSPFVPSRYGDRQLFFRHHHGCKGKDLPASCGGLTPAIR